MRDMGYRIGRIGLKRSSAALVAVALVAALTAVVNLNAKPAAASSGDFSVSVILYDDANWTGYATILTESHPDLSQIGWSGRISSLRIWGGISIAVYSQPNYAGTCDTFYGHDPWLGNDRIGNDRIASIKLSANCSGPVEEAVVTEITAVAGSSDQVLCPDNYVKRDTDLNKGAGGDYIYLCLRYGAEAALSDEEKATGVISYVGVLPPVFACGNTWSGPVQVPLDLNKGAGGAYIYLCYWTYDITSQPGASRAPHISEISLLRDVEFVVSDSAISMADLPGHCNDVFEDVVNGRIHPLYVNAVEDDLNFGAGGKYIYACTLNYDHAPPSVPVPPETISLISRVPPPNPAGWNRDAVHLVWGCPPRLNGFDLVRDEIRQTVSSEGAGQSATARCKLLPKSLGSHTVTDINIDRTSPVIVFADRTPPNANGWNAGDVTIRWNCADALSGVVQPVAVVTVTTEGVNQSATGTCTDRADNTASRTQAGINIDKTAPTLYASAVMPPPNAYGWHNSDVTISWECSDALSGVLLPPTPQVVDGHGDKLSATGSCTDRADNTTSDTVAVRIDRKSPKLAAVATTADGAPYVPGTWTNQNVDVTFNCVDSPSGVLSVTPPLAFGAGSWPGVTGFCLDKAGNESMVTLDIYIDETPPVLKCAAQPAHFAKPTYTLEEVAVQLRLFDEQSGPGLIELVSVTSSEPDSGLDPDDQAGDILKFDVGTADTEGVLRAEAFTKDRVYTLTYRGTDAAGNASICKTTVTVELPTP